MNCGKGIVLLCMSLQIYIHIYEYILYTIEFCNTYISSNGFVVVLASIKIVNNHSLSQHPLLLHCTLASPLVSHPLLPVIAFPIGTFPSLHPVVTYLPLLYCSIISLLCLLSHFLPSAASHCLLSLVNEGIYCQHSFCDL